MSRTSHRVQLARAYVLHQRPFRDSSLIVEVFARDYGRMTVFARAARGPRSRFAVLQPFRALLLSWSGRGEAPQLTGAENADGPSALPAAHLMSAFYLNELLLKLTTRHDPNADLFDAYQTALLGLACGGAQEAPLRNFELRLLQEVGYGVDLTQTVAGGPVTAQGYYHFRPADGLFTTTAEHSGALPGSSLLQLAAGQLQSVRELADARKVLAAALEHCLEGRPIVTRAIARACVGTALVPAPAAGTSKA